MAVHRPATAGELAGLIRAAAGDGRRLELRGGGSKTAIGRAGRDDDVIDMRGFAGVIDYDPAELVLTVGAGTPLAEIAALVAGSGQMLAFDPFDHGPVFGRAAGAATIGGIVAAAVGGSRRLSAGGVRDHLLGFAAVSGRGEAFVAGAKVVKNVTGYDLSKLVCGSWGRLVALTEVTLKVLPCPCETATLLYRGPLDEGRRIMTAAMGSQAGVAAAGHADGVTALRIEGFGPSVKARVALLDDLLGAGEAGDDGFWDDLRTLAPLAGAGELWRVSVPIRASGDVIAAVPGARCMIDWAGGLVWLAADGAAEAVRAAAGAAGGHAMLVRGQSAATFQPQPAGLAALEARVRRSFDPAGAFETGRFDAD